jgi:hypothetical protein
MKYIAIILLLISCSLVASCDKQRVASQQVPPAHSIVDTVPHKKEKDRFINLRQFADSLPPYYARIARFYFNKYTVDSCGTSMYDGSYWAECFRSIRRIDDLNGNGKYDSVFILQQSSFATVCEDGQSYYFLDTTLPRLETGSECCDPQNMFEVGDLDEDGLKEIGIYYSSCASHYKLLRVYSLKDRDWKLAGECVYDLYYNDYESDYRRFVRKTGKGKFEMLEQTDMTDDTSKIGVKNLLKFEM